MPVPIELVEARIRDGMNLDDAFDTPMTEDVMRAY